ncbi:Zn-ribbon domain-containing OB-fold protein [Antrihabitans cavernicola]|uniref:DNA-binding protein n=1 Tax=Antrihabitans cavernicola TaxID=2495913 RepID=A0A5A7SBJ3_9NOCA|nr:OB-fold nucleic acid binding domain-containing protein [Spelaeibacter cavernicola]KAA0021953.1 DNA-binding protein [Spelaeibacter cavernicola]
MSVGNSIGHDEPPLSAPLNPQFDYTRSVGPTIGGFLTALRERRVVGARGSDGRVYVPPPEYDPVTFAPPTDLIDVADVGTVLTWSWVAKPSDGQPLDKPFAFALIRLDGADTALLHAVDVETSDRMSTGMRVHARWAQQPTGSIHDVVCFDPGEPETSTVPMQSDEPAVTVITTPVRLEYMHTASDAESNYLRALAQGKLLGGRTDPNGKIYIPPRGASPADGRPTTEYVELPDHGIVTTFCVVNVPFLGQRIKPPYIAAYVLVDGADIAFLHLILECDPAEVRMGMRVEAVWKPREQWGYSLENIDHFRPTGEPDADYDSYKHHL